MDAYSAIDILECFKDNNERSEMVKLAIDAGYSPVPSENGDKVKRFDGKIKYGTSPELENWLVENGVPFKRFTSAYEDFPAEVMVFDGIRKHSVPSDTQGNALVDMRVVRSIIDMLENDDELRALSYSNGHWIETDVTNMYRWGMEETIEISSEKKDYIDAEIEEKE